MPKGIKYFGEGLPYLTAPEGKGKLIAIEGTDGVGRSTQIELLIQWLKVRGYGVVTTGWTRSKLMSRAISFAKSGNMLDRMTFSLLYATDFADRLENEIIPALRSGFIVIADRYTYSAWARDSARDPNMTWIKDLYGFAPIPDLVCYLRLDVENLIPRVIESGGMDYWESGMDLHLADNIFDSFKKYQRKMIAAYDEMAEEFAFEVLDARGTVVEIQNDLRNRIEKVIGGPPAKVVQFNPGGSLKGELTNREAQSLNFDDIKAQSKQVALKRFISGSLKSSVAEERSFPLQEEFVQNSEASDTGLPFSSIWTPSFHIPKDPQSNNS